MIGDSDGKGGHVGVCPICNPGYPKYTASIMVPCPHRAKGRQDDLPDSEQSLQPRSLGDVLKELADFPPELIVKSAVLNLVTDMGNRMEYRYVPGRGGAK